ncbi:uncharacterized protein LOC128211442 [Mya arenaria]|uniref:uncharacterized protein LOC128211442 n=1 Tax=Mya arenaria TaxID=6604 RepID=UPI0022E7A04E|nr:uncharacterized protein LOC128211442 [Mya arenaria]
MDTSTPVVKRTRAAKNVQKVTNLSHIENVESPISDTGYNSVQTPESTHSQSVYETPSVVSSQGSRVNDDNLSEVNADDTGRKAVVQLKKLADSFVAYATSDSAKSHAFKSRRKEVLEDHSYDNSKSLFSGVGAALSCSPCDSKNHRLTRATAQRRGVKPERICLDDSNEESVDETDEISHDEHEDDNIEVSVGSESTEDDEEDYHTSEGETEDLSAIAEGEEISEEDESDTECVESDGSEEYERESDSEKSSEFGRETRSTKKTSGTEKDKAFERLSESLLSNHVIERRSTRNTRKTRHRDSDLHDISDITDLLEMSHIDSSDSNCTLYMLNEDSTSVSSKHSTGRLSGHTEEEEVEEERSSEEEGSVDEAELEDDVEEEERKSVLTKHRTRRLSGHTEEEEVESSSGEEGNDVDDEMEDDVIEEEEDIEEDKDIEPMEESLHTPARKKYCLRDKYLEDLQNSFSEILTPVRRKSSLVPLSAQARVFLLCDQTEPITFKDALPGRMMSKCRKIGEGVYGEVFRSTGADNKNVAIKIIPIEGDFAVNDEPQKKFGEILPEIVIAKELSNLRTSKGSMTASFCEVNDVSCVRGKYPKELLTQWDTFNKNKSSENDRPDMFGDTQLFIVFEFADCGSSLESYEFETISQGKSVLTQVAYALAVAEEKLQFEHRDLHWGNVLVRPTEDEVITFQLLGKTYEVPSMGVEASVIDFTLSRLTKDGCTVFTDLSVDPALFEGKGDYQFDIYRLMKEGNGNQWKKFEARSNVLWLHYLADKLIYATRYPSQSGRQDRDVIRQFRQFTASMLNYNSSVEMVVDALFLNS